MIFAAGKLPPCSKKGTARAVPFSVSYSSSVIFVNTKVLLLWDM